MDKVTFQSTKLGLHVRVYLGEMRISKGDNKHMMEREQNQHMINIRLTAYIKYTLKTIGV